MTTDLDSRRAPLRLPWWLGAAVFAMIAVFFLWEEHRAHLLGAVPWLLVLACPLMHLFMHGGHRHGTGADPDRKTSAGSHPPHHGGKP